MATARVPGKQIGLYLLLLVAFSAIFEGLVIASGSLGNAAGMYVLGAMWSPALAAVLTMKLSRRPLAELGWSAGPSRYLWQSWMVPLLYAAIAYGFVWASGLGAPTASVEKAQRFLGLHLPGGASVALMVALIAIYGLPRSLSSATGEEIGWRGFLVPALYSRYGFTRTSLITGVIWSCWHYPVLIFADYKSTAPTWYALTCFTVMVVAISFVFTWYRMKSGSLWTGALLHASHNLYIQAIFTPFTRDTGHTAWFIDEFGCVVPLVAVGFAIYFWTRRRELPGYRTAAEETAEIAASSGSPGQ